MCTKEKCIGLPARLEIGLNIKFTNYHCLNNTLPLMLLSFFLLIALEGGRWCNVIRSMELRIQFKDIMYI